MHSEDGTRGVLFSGTSFLVLFDIETARIAGASWLLLSDLHQGIAKAFSDGEGMQGTTYGT